MKKQPVDKKAYRMHLIGTLREVAKELPKNSGRANLMHSAADMLESDMVMHERMHSTVNKAIIKLDLLLEEKCRKPLL